MAEKVTLESLAGIVARGFEESRKETSEAIESLAAMTARGFSESRKEIFEEIEKLTKEMKQMRKELNQLQEDVDIGFASLDKRLEEYYQSQLNSHAIRIKNLEMFTGVEVAK
ncbi:MAG: hypothetical protein Q7S26_03090 [bacterium]|nr:hypothetical protein [bacterium]